MILFDQYREEYEELVILTSNYKQIPESYNPLGDYEFHKWSNLFNDEIRKKYEELHIDLLYTNEKQDFLIAVNTFREINEIFQSIKE